MLTSVRPVSGARWPTTGPNRLRAEALAEFLVHDIMENIYGNWVVKFSLKGVVEAPVQDFFTDTDSFYAGRLAYWGIVPVGSSTRRVRLLTVR